MEPRHGQCRNPWHKRGCTRVLTRDRTRINWYLATVYTQLVFYTQDEELADKLTDGECARNL